MTDSAMVDEMSLAAGDAPGRALQQVPRGLAAQAVIDTLSGLGAKAGLAWMCIVGFCAVFAPFLANSYPLAVKIGGKWSSPLLRHLTPVDVILLVMFFACAILVFYRRLAFPRKLLVACATVVVITPLAYLFVRPPLLNVFEEYREAAREGKIQSAIYAPIRYSANDRMRDQPESRLSPPSRQHLLGTEDTGGDLLSRMIHACRIAMSIGFISTGIAIVIGIVVGGVMGYFVGPVDLFGMRLIEIFEAIPTLFLLIAIVAFFGRNLYIMMAIIGLTTWTGDARFIRGEFLRLRNQDFVHAAVAAGLPVRSVLFRHILPNGISPLIVSASFGIASAILYESTLSFLGLGLVDEPSWGQMLEQSLGVGGTFIWWIAFFPGLAIFLTVFAYNLIGEALRDALDPRLHGIE